MPPPPTRSPDSRRTRDCDSLPAATIAQLLRHYARLGRATSRNPTAKRSSPRGPISLAAIAGLACLSRRTVEYAAKGTISPRSQRLLSHALEYARKHRQVWPAAHSSSDLEALAHISYARIFINDISAG